MLNYLYILSVATITEIAKKTNVSITTVSRVLNYDKTLQINDEKRKLILEVAEKLDYQTPRRKNNKLKKSLKFGLIHWYTIAQELDDTYYLSIRLGIERTCYENKIDVIKIFKDAQTRSYNLDDIKDVDGVIAVGKFSKEEVELMHEKFQYIVFVDSSPQENNFDSVVIDFESAFISAIDYVLSLGHERIGYIGGREYIGKNIMSIGERREIIFTEYLTKKGLFNSEDVHIGNFTIESGYALMKKAIEKNNLPTAFLVGSDGMAIGLLKAAYEAGIKIPKDISIVSFNDITQSQYTIPPLTTVRVYKDYMGVTAVELLLERLDKKLNIPKKVVIPTELVIRESCAKYKK